MSGGSRSIHPPATVDSDLIATHDVADALAIYSTPRTADKTKLGARGDPIWDEHGAQRLRARALLSSRSLDHAGRGVADRP
jgi:hypothetical protein